MSPGPDPDPTARTTRRLLFWLVAMSLVLRVVFVAVIGEGYAFGDSVEYDRVARSLLTGETLSAGSPRQPLFPLLIAANHLLGAEEGHVPIRLLVALFGAGVVAATAALGLRVGGRATAVLAAAAAAVFPTFVFVSGILYPTTLYTLLLLGATLIARRTAERPSVPRGLGLGVLLALGWLTDQVFLIPAVTLVAWTVVAARRPRRRVLAPAILALLVLVSVFVLALSAMRRDDGRPTPFMAKAQYVLHFARTDSTTAQHRRIRFDQDAPFEALSRGGFIRQEIGFLRSRPADYLHDYGLELAHFFDPMPDRIQSDTAYTRRAVLWLGLISFLPVLVLAPVGLVVGRASWRDRLLLAVVPGATAAFYALFFTQTRYRIPVEPYLLVLAALALVRLAPRRFRDVRPSPTPDESR
jgi:4-amino-4-deoxy-L-arabinose transferase-like glycosyltransferase